IYSVGGCGPAPLDELPTSADQRLSCTSMSSTRPDLLDPATIAALGRIEIVARWIVDGFLTGLHRSPSKGFSVEFAEHRPYLPGDELRYVDWKIAARADKWVVKQYEEETNLRATIVLDVSRSMAWRGDESRLTKLAYAERLAAAIALLFLRQRDAVGLVRFDDAVRSAVPPRVRTGQWQRIVAALDDPGAGRASFAPVALEQAGRLIARRGMIVLISDLLMDPPDVIARVPARGDALFVDPESEIEVPAASADVRAAYRETVDRALGEWHDAFAGVGAAYELITTDAPFGVPLRRAFAVRQRLP